MDFTMSVIGASFVLLVFFTLIGLVYTVIAFVRFRTQKKHYVRLHAALAPGSQVVLVSGIYGTITKVSGETCELEIAPGVCIKVSRFSIQSLS